MKGTSMAEYLTKNIVLEPLDIEIVTEYAERRGLNNNQGFSAAVRGILREYAELKHQVVPQPGITQPAPIPQE